jgi:hypothetical protein
LGARTQRFYELAAAGPAPIASEALQRIAELYAIEPEAAAAVPTSAARCASRVTWLLTATRNWQDATVRTVRIVRAHGEIQPGQ